MTKKNTIVAALNTIRVIDNLTERLACAKDGSEVSGKDLLLTVQILRRVSNSFLTSTAYPPFELDGDEVSA